MNSGRSEATQYVICHHLMKTKFYQMLVNWVTEQCVNNSFVKRGRGE